MVLRKPQSEKDNFGDRKSGCATDSTFENDTGVFRTPRLTKYCHRSVKEKSSPRKTKSSFFLTKIKKDETGKPHLHKEEIFIPEPFRLQASDVSRDTIAIIINQGKT